MNTTSSINIREVAFPTILSMVLFSAAIFLPPLGILFSIFCPVPIILAYLYRGQSTGLISSIIVAIILFLFVNVQISLVFFAEYGLIAVIMAESIRRNYSIDKIVLHSVGASFLLGGVLIYLFLLAKDINLSSFMTEQIKQSMASSIDAYRQMGISNSEIDNIKLYSEKLASVFISSIPAWMIVSSSIGVLLNYMLVKMIWNKYIGNSSFFHSHRLLLPHRHKSLNFLHHFLELSSFFLLLNYIELLSGHFSFLKSTHVSKTPIKITRSSNKGWINIRP